MADVDSKRKLLCQETKCRNIETTSYISDDEEILCYCGLKEKFQWPEEGSNPDPIVRKNIDPLCHVFAVGR